MCNWLTTNEILKIETCGANFGVPRSATRVATEQYLEGHTKTFNSVLSEWADQEAIDAIERKIKEYTEGD